MTSLRSGISPDPMLSAEYTENRGRATPERLLMPMRFHFEDVTEFKRESGFNCYYVGDFD
jgi:hypothetical protein